MRLISPDVIAIVTLFQEAEGEPYDGKVAVGEVIRRRASRRYSSDGTVDGACLRRFQFSGWNSDATNRLRSLRIDGTDPVVIECIRAWADSETSKLVPDAVLYHATSIPAPSWADPLRFVRQIGHHRFFRA